MAGCKAAGLCVWCFEHQQQRRQEPQQHELGVYVLEAVQQEGGLQQLLQRRSQPLSQQQQEPQQQPQQLEQETQVVCPICYDALPTRAMVPCGHTLCADCWPSVCPSATCPVCRGALAGPALKLFFS